MARHQKDPPLPALYEPKIEVRAQRRPTGPYGRAKILTEEQFHIALAKTAEFCTFPLRDRMFLLFSHKCGLRAKEIANIWFEDVTDVQGNLAEHLQVTKRGAKYGKERRIFMKEDLRAALREYIERTQIKTGPLFWTQHKEVMTSNAVQKQIKAIYRACGFQGARSHSGRRTAITLMAQKANTVGASLKDVMKFAGHADLATTEAYIDTSPQQEKLTDLLY